MPTHSGNKRTGCTIICVISVQRFGIWTPYKGELTKQAFFTGSKDHIIQLAAKKYAVIGIFSIT